MFSRGWGRLRKRHCHMYTTMCEIASEREAAVARRELSVVLSDDLEGRGREQEGASAARAYIYT